MEVREGYKQSDVGVIPEDWDALKIGVIANTQRGASPRPIDNPIWFDNQSNTGWLRISDVTKAKKYLLETTQNLSVLGIANSRFVEKNNLVMSICATVGRPILTRKEVCIHDGFVVFNNLKVGKEYLYYVLADIEKDWSKRGQTGSQMNLNTGLINSIPIPIPPTKTEQTAIANTLSDADALIQSLTRLIAKKRQIKQGTMQTLLNPYENGRLKDGWAVKKLGDIVEFNKGKGLPKSQLTPSGKYECIHYGELFTRYKERILNVHSRTDFNDSTYVSKSNDILMPTSDVTPNGLATASCIMKAGVILGGDILVIRPKDNTLDGVFFSYLINIEREQVMRLVSGSTVYHLYGSDMANFELVIPECINEQNRIAAILSDMDSEITILETKLTKSKQIKQGMMQNLLTGKIRLI